MTVHDGPYQFFEAGEFDQTYRDLDRLVAAKEIQSIAGTFIASLDRIRHLHDMPIQLIAWADHLATCHATIRFSYGLAATDTSKDQDPEYGDRVSREFLNGRASRDAREFGAVKLEGMTAWEIRQHVDNPPASTGAEALFAAMVMGAYAALETLAADLWVVALNKRSTLATNWLKANDQKSVSANALLGHGFDWSDKMGTVLHESRKVTFESWRDIRSAYSDAFAGALDGPFEPAQPIFLAEKTRHLFAHRGGLVDRKFKDEMKDFPEFAGLVIGERLRLTGPIVRDRVDACLKCGADLLVGVDQWVTQNV